MEIRDDEAAETPRCAAGGRDPRGLCRQVLPRRSSDGGPAPATTPSAPCRGQEALEVLGLEPGADEAAIRAAHKRLLSLVHPDRSGSAWLAQKVQQARDTLLAPSREWETAAPRNRAAKR